METTGLEPAGCIPLELGFLITDIELNPIEGKSWIIYEPNWENGGQYRQENIDPYVWDMHVKSGLWDERTSGHRVAQVEYEACAWLDSHEVSREDPICGSSVQFDRDWMKYWFSEAQRKFSYRNIDISTVKELMKRFSPEIYAMQDSTDYYLNRKMHRMMPDIEDTISEFKFYRKEFLYVPTDFMTEPTA